MSASCAGPGPRCVDREVGVDVVLSPGSSSRTLAPDTMFPTEEGRSRGGREDVARRALTCPWRGDQTGFHASMARPQREGPRMPGLRRGSSAKRPCQSISSTESATRAAPEEPVAECGSSRGVVTNRPRCPRCSVVQHPAQDRVLVDTLLCGQLVLHHVAAAGVEEPVKPPGGPLRKVRRGRSGHVEHAARRPKQHRRRWRRRR